jgi:hypothetical protein
MRRLIYHRAHVKPRLGPWDRVKRVYRTAIVHVFLEFAGGHAWNALALIAMAGLAAIPPELLSAHASLRTTAPIVLAVLGIAARITGRTRALENPS